MIKVLAVNITRKIYPSRDMEKFLRICELINVLLILVICALVGMAYALITRGGASLILCAAVLAACVTGFFIIWLLGRRLPGAPQQKEETK